MTPTERQLCRAVVRLEKKIDELMKISKLSIPDHRWEPLDSVSYICPLCQKKVEYRVIEQPSSPAQTNVEVIRMCGCKVQPSQLTDLNPLTTVSQR